MEESFKWTHASSDQELADALRPLITETTTLRDQFAMAALTGLCSDSTTLRNLFSSCPPGEAMLAGSRGCYQWADAMLEARKPK